MGYTPSVCGYTRITVSGIIGDSGKPIAVTGYSVLSGATAAVPYLRNGTGVAGDTQVCRLPGTANISVETVKPLPTIIPSGCYISFDANTTEVTVYFYQQSVTS
ncbi:MAG TPA: hypothetical protein VF974_08260 [Patescibacteria group bacterium]